MDQPDIAEIEEAATAEAFNLCCNWLVAKGRRDLAEEFAAFVQSLDQVPGHADLMLSPEAIDAATEGAEIPGLDIPPPKAMGYTGDSCGTCGGLRMRRNGTCLLCEDCGSTTGCS